MNNIPKYVSAVPDYLKYMWDNHFVLTVVIISVFVLAAFFNFKFVPFIRKTLVAALILLGLAGAVNGRRQHGYQMLLTSAMALVLLLLIRILMNAITEIRRNRLNARIEKRQLERARNRRGDFSRRRGYSGKVRPETVPEAVDATVRADIEEVISSKVQNAENEHPHASKNPYFSPESDEDTGALPEGVFYAKPAEKPFSGNSVLAADVYEALLKLGTLKESGIITDLEFQQKKAELLAKIK